MEHENIILEFLKTFRVDMDNKLDSMKTDINEKFNGHSDWISNNEKKTETAIKEMGIRIGLLEQANAAYKVYIKIIGTVSSITFVAIVGVLINLIFGGK